MKSVYAAIFFFFVVVESFIFFSSAVPLTSFAFLLLGRLLLWSVLFSREGDVASVYIKPTRCYFKESSRFQSLLLLLHCVRSSLCRRRLLFRLLLCPSGFRELSVFFFFFNVMCLPLVATGPRRWICVVFIVLYICCLSWFFLAEPLRFSDFSFLFGFSSHCYVLFYGICCCVLVLCLC